MKNNLYRTGITSLTDDELILLDVMFAYAVLPPMLRQCNIKPQFNIRPHSMDDATLKSSLVRFAKEGITQRTGQFLKGREYIKINEFGGEIWCSERSPVWERYCSDRESATIGSNTIYSVCAVSPKIRDDYLRISIPNSARTRTATISDNGILPWKTFDRLYVGLASFPSDPDSFELEDFDHWLELRKQHIITVGRERTWWRSAR